MGVMLSEPISLLGVSWLAETLDAIGVTGWRGVGDPEALWSVPLSRLGLDSLACVELFLRLEEATGSQYAVEEVDGEISVGALLSQGGSGR